MNETQKEALCKFIDAVEDMMPHLILIVGYENTNKLLTAAAELKSVMKE